MIRQLEENWFNLLFIRWRWHIMHRRRWRSFLNFHHCQRCFRFGKRCDGVIHRCFSVGRWLRRFSCLITQLGAFHKLFKQENTFVGFWKLFLVLSGTLLQKINPVRGGREVKKTEERVRQQVTMFYELGGACAFSFSLTLPKNDAHVSI